MRNIIFQIAYWLTGIFFVLTAIPLLFIPGRRVLMRWLQIYSSTMVWLMRVVCGIEVEYRGLEHVPDGSAIIAAKHQSWGDGYATFSQIPDLAIVTGDHLEKMPLVGLILRKMEAVVVDSCGGAEARERLVDRELKKAREQGRRVLIYPEGQLVKPGYHARYKKGIYHMYEAYGCRVVPVATNLGLFWPKSEWGLKPGKAVVEFLPAIGSGMEKEAFMAELQDRIETASLALLPDDFEIPKNREVQDEGR